MKVVISIQQSNKTTHNLDLYIDKDAFELCPASKRPSGNNLEEELRKIARLIIIHANTTNKIITDTSSLYLKRVTWTNDTMTAILADENGVSTITVENTMQGTPEIYYRAERSHPAFDITVWEKNDISTKINDALKTLKAELFLAGNYNPFHTLIDISSDKAVETVKLEPSLPQVALSFPDVRSTLQKFDAAKRVYDYRRERTLVYQADIQKTLASFIEPIPEEVRVYMRELETTASKIKFVFDAIGIDQQNTEKLRTDYQSDVFAALSSWRANETVINRMRFYFATALHNTFIHFISLISKNGVTRESRIGALASINDLLKNDRLVIESDGNIPTAQHIYEDSCRYPSLETTITRMLTLSQLMTASASETKHSLFLSQTANYLRQQLEQVATVISQKIQFDPKMANATLASPKNKTSLQAKPAFTLGSSNITWRDDIAQFLEKHGANESKNSTELSEILSPVSHIETLNKSEFLEAEVGEIASSIEETRTQLACLHEIIKLRTNTYSLEQEILLTRDKIKQSKSALNQRINKLIESTKKSAATEADRSSITAQLRQPHYVLIKKEETLTARTLANAKLDDAIRMAKDSAKGVITHLSEARANFISYKTQLVTVRDNEYHLLDALDDNLQIIQDYETVMRFREKIITADRNIQFKKAELQQKLADCLAKISQLPNNSQTAALTKDLTQLQSESEQLFAAIPLSIAQFSAEIKAMTLQTLSKMNDRKNQLTKLGIFPSESSRYKEEYHLPLLHYGQQLDKLSQDAFEFEGAIDLANKTWCDTELERKLSAALEAPPAASIAVTEPNDHDSTTTHGDSDDVISNESDETKSPPIEEHDDDVENSHEKINEPEQASSSFWQRHRVKILASVTALTALGAAAGATAGFLGLFGLGAAIGAGIGAASGFVFGLVQGLIIAGIAECCRPKTSVRLLTSSQMDTPQSNMTTASLARSLRAIRNHAPTLKDNLPDELTIYRTMPADSAKKDPAAVVEPVTEATHTVRQRKK